MPKPTDIDNVSILGVNIDAISNADAINYICDRAKPGQPAAFVIKPYVEFLDRAYRDQSLRDLLNGADLALADGVSLNWAAAFLYAGPRSSGRFWLTLAQIVLAPDRLRWPLPDRGAGTNFTWPLLEAAASHKVRVYLIGKESDQDIAAVSGRISQRNPDIQIVGTKNGVDNASAYRQVSEAWLEQTAAAIQAAKADLVLVGMGFPLQEKVCAYLAGHLNHGVFIGEGGTFDYESFGGTMRKAPSWMQRTGLEWLWRLILEPKRITRQLAIPLFIYQVWRSR